MNQAPARIRARWEKLKALVERPGTPGEGAAAARALRRLERRWAFEKEPESCVLVPREYVVSATAWVPGHMSVRFRSDPFRGPGRVQSVRLVAGTGLQAERDRLFVVSLNVVGIGGSRVLKTCEELATGDVVEVLLRSNWHLASRVALHFTCQSYGGEEPVFRQMG